MTPKPSGERDERPVDDAVELHRALAAQELRHRRHAADLHAQLEAMRSSLPWRVVTAAYSWLDRLAPPTTRRRNAYAAVVRRVKRGRRGTSVPGSGASPSGTAALASIRIPAPTDPFVSIVISVNGGVDAAARCLAALADERSSAPVEVILVDDGSSPDRAEMLRLVDNVRVVIADDGGRSLIASCQRGLAEARGELVVLLSSDTQVRPGWLDAMIAAVRDDERVGVVGAQLLRPDGSIEEAGGIVWSDGSTSSYGRGDDPSKPQYSYLREVDYCSSSSLLVRRDLLARLLGDPRLGSDHAADISLAFAARSLGYRVVYQPAAVVVHQDPPRREGAEGPDPDCTGFEETWRAEVSPQHPPDPSRLLLARDRRGSRVLVADQCVPARDQDAGSLRMHSLLSLLTDLGFAVTFLPDNGVRTEPHTTSLQQQGVEVLYGDVDVAAHVAGLSADLALCILSRPHVARRYLGLVREHAPGTAVVYDTVDLHFLREERRSRLPSLVREGRAVRSPPGLELELVRASDATIAISGEEREVLGRALPSARLFVVPTVHEPRPPSERRFEDRRDLLFVGSFEHPPNVDAVVFFVGDVLPLVRQRLSNVRLTVVGRKPPPVVSRLAGDAVDVVGWVPELAGLYERHRVGVAPLRYGAGLKGKVGESLSWGLPLVTTPVGAEGFGAEHGRHLLIGASPGELADEVVRLYTDPVLWDHLAREGRELVQERHSLPAVRQRVVDMLDALGVGRVRSGT